MTLRNELSSPPSPIEEKKPDYCISYAVFAEEHAHRFIIISKKIKNQYEVIASFGLYYDSSYDSSVVVAPLWGGVDIPGRIRSDHFYTNLPKPDDDPFERKDVYVKSYPITQENALNLLKEVQKDSMINREVAKDKVNIEKKFQPSKNLSPEEQVLQTFYFKELNKNQKGGPTYNNDNFDCNHYALLKLKKLGIRDADLEKTRPDTADEEIESIKAAFKKASFEANVWKSDINLVEIPEPPKLNFPKKYETLFKGYATGRDRALAVLRDYAQSGFLNFFAAPKRRHKLEIAIIVKHIDDHPKEFKTVRDVVRYVTENMPKFYNINGSLARRVDFIISKQEPELQLTKDRTPPSTPDREAKDSPQPHKRKLSK